MVESVGALPNTKKSAGGRVGAKSGTLSAKVALMKMKQKADGPQSIPQVLHSPVPILQPIVFSFQQT